MESSPARGMGYVIPRYRAGDEVPWYHVLHGNVPDHQIDFMYCPEVPQGRLTATHFSHLARLMKYIEPQTNATHAFAIGNLSRDDTQYEAGHGAVGLIFGFRIGGTTDHAGRGNPPFAHGLIAVDRELSYAGLLEASATFYRHVMNANEASSSAAVFYREYIGAVVEGSERVGRVLERYVDEYGDLPYLGRSTLPWEWVAEESAQPKRVVIVHADDEPFGSIAHAAAKIAATLYRSNIKWTSITTGREADIPGGVSVRIVGERDAGAEDRNAVTVRIEDVAQDEGEIARQLFGAKPYVAEAERPKYAGWRERYAAQQGGGAEAGAGAGAGGGQTMSPPSSQPRTLTPVPPSRHRIERNDLRMPGPTGRSTTTDRPSGVPAPPPSSSRSVGPQGTLVIDREKLLGGTMRSQAALAEAEAAAGAAVLAGQRQGNGRAEAPAGAAWGNGEGVVAAPQAAAPRTPEAVAQAFPAGGQVFQAGEQVFQAGSHDEIPVIVEKPESSRKWVWALVVLGCAVAVGIAVVVAALTSSAEQPGTPATESAAPEGAASTEPSSARVPTATGPTAPTTAKNSDAESSSPQASTGEKQDQAGHKKPEKAPGGASKKYPPTPGHRKVPTSSLPEGKADF